MQNLISSLLILMFCGLTTAAANESLYYDHVLDADGDDYVANLNLNPIGIKNRAACAEASKSPADSAFMIVDAELVGQTAYRIYQNSDKKISDKYYKVYALKEFRLRLTRLSQQIHDLLLSGRLPIIPDDQTKLQQFPVLNRLLQECPDWNCRELDDYIVNLGNYFVNGDDNSGREVDRFLRIGQIKLSDQAQNNYCYYLKKFSPLQANLFTDTTGTDILNAMGQAYDKQQALVTECIDPNPALPNSYFAMQTEFKITDKDKFARYGFDYWHSFKIYLQAWWRLDYSVPTVVEGQNQAKLDWFKELDLTSILMITPNSCKSIEKPTCDNSFLAINSLRKLSALDKDKLYQQVTGNSSRHLTDHTESLPSGAQADLVRDPKPAVNTDIAGIRTQSDAREWLKNFYANISKRKAIYNARLWEAVNVYNLLLGQLDIERLDKELEKEFDEAKRTKNFNTFYYMCTEYAVANTDYLSNMDEQHQHLQKLTSLQKIHPLLDTEKLGQISTYYTTLSKKIASICNYLTKREIFDAGNFSSNYAYFRPWFLDYMQFYSVRPLSLYDPSQPSLVEQEGFDLLPNVMKHKCSKATDCARLALDASVNLHSVATYAEVFFQTKSEIMTPDLFNPYSERVACNTYDPWKRKRNSLKMLSLDLLNVALFSWNPSPLLIAFDIKEGQLLNFDKLIDDGKIQYVANMTKDKVRASLIARLGPINGSACQVVIGSVPLNAGEVYPGAFGFLGMNIAYNHTRVKSTQGTFEGITLPKDERGIALTDDSSRTFGIGCQLFFTPLSKQEYSQLQDRDFSPIKFAVTLFRSIYNFITFRKHPDVPFEATYDINQVYESYKVNDGIPKKCVKKLAQQKRCFDNNCEQATVDFMQATFGGQVRRYYYDKWTKKTVVHMSSCDGFYEIDSSRSGCLSSRDQKNYKDKIKAFGSCKL